MAEDLTAFPKFALDKIHRVGVNNEPETILNYNTYYVHINTPNVQHYSAATDKQAITMHDGTV